MAMASFQLDPAVVDPPKAGATIVRKTADQTINNSEVLVNDAHLVLPVLANEIWFIEMSLMLWQANATADWNFGWAYPVATTMKWGTDSDYWKATAVQDLQEETEQAVAMNALAAQILGIALRAIVIVGGNAGNINLQWAQLVATEANNTIKENSCLIAHKLA